jgi:hypothetical protein
MMPFMMPSAPVKERQPGASVGAGRIMVSGNYATAGRDSRLWRIFYSQRGAVGKLKITNLVKMVGAAGIEPATPPV